MTNQDGGLDWDASVAQLWAKFDNFEHAEFLAAMQQLVATSAPSKALGYYELASAYDAIGEETIAAENYEYSFEHGLDESKIRSAIIQYASTLRNLGSVHQAIELLRKEQLRKNDHLDSAVSAFLALCLHDEGSHAQALSVALIALEPHLSSFNRSIRNYADDLVKQ